MNVPEIIDRYFSADRGQDESALDPLFLADATVTDEGHRHHGVDAIKAWRRQAKARYGHQVAPLDATSERGRVRLRAEVTGPFPGSPLHCTYLFRVQDDRIAALEITA